MSAPPRSQLLQGVWWLFSFPWTIFELGIDAVARGTLFMLALLPPSVLFSTLQFFERGGRLTTGACVYIFSLLLRLVQLLTGTDSKEGSVSRRASSSQVGPHASTKAHHPTHATTSRITPPPTKRHMHPPHPSPHPWHHPHPTRTLHAVPQLLQCLRAHGRGGLGGRELPRDPKPTLT